MYLQKLDPVIITCVCFWSIINVLCMSVGSPYHSAAYYALILSAGVIIGYFILRFLPNSTIYRASLIGWLIHLAMILYLILFTKGIKGGRRWIVIRQISYQPSECLKLCLAILFSKLVSEGRFFLAGLLSLISISLLAIQPDLGNAILMSLLCLICLFIWGARKRHLTLILAGLSISLYTGISLFPHASKRLRSFSQHVSTQKPKPDSAYQNLRAIAAIQRGGLVGLGAGKGVVKRFLPDAYSDFIFAVIAEELGLIGCTLVCLSFLVFFLRCMFNAQIMHKSSESLVIIAIGTMISLQAWIHMASNVWLIPTKGTTLPFISHGGTSMLVLYIALSIILKFTITGHKERVLK